MKDGVTIRSSRAKSGVSLTKNAMVIFDPARWKPVEIYKMGEHDSLPRATSGSVGYEDIRLFRTDRYGLQGIAAALHLQRNDHCSQLAEQVLLWFDEEYNIVEARPIRGLFSSTAQKNWVPFDHCMEPRFLYSIDRGTLFNDHGEIHEAARPSMRPRHVYGPDSRSLRRAQERAGKIEHVRMKEERKHARSQDKRSKTAAIVQAAGYEGLRGGTQLLRVGEDAWLGLGHSMRFVENLKYYWHVWYVVDARGKIKSVSPPMKLAPNGIEFAAGIAADGERVVVSFGVDDMQCRLGETKLSAVLETLRPVER